MRQVFRETLQAFPADVAPGVTANRGVALARFGPGFAPRFGPRFAPWPAPSPVQKPGRGRASQGAHPGTDHARGPRQKKGTAPTGTAPDSPFKKQPQTRGGQSQGTPPSRSQKRVWPGFFFRWFLPIDTCAGNWGFPPCGGCAAKTAPGAGPERRTREPDLKARPRRQDARRARPLSSWQKPLRPPGR